MYDILIIGGGPAGLTAATYACRAGKSVLVLEKAVFGGQITWSPRVENFPGFVSISGNELGDKLMEQAMEQGAEVELEEVTGLEKTDEGWKLLCDSGAAFEGRAVILAGVGYCAVCDGAFFKNKAVAVNGGGNSALQDALLLSETCSKVYLIHRRDAFRGEQKLVDALQERANVEFVLNASVTALLGEEELCGLTVEQNGASRELAVEGLFVAIGHQPDLEAFAPWLNRDKAGYADAQEDCLTPTEGLFVAGDCRKKSVRQLTTAVADGAVAALAACHWLDR